MFFISKYILLFYWQRLVCEDITGGLEDVPIPATNLVDDPPVAPLGKLHCKFSMLLFISYSFIKNPKNLSYHEGNANMHIKTT